MDGDGGMEDRAKIPWPSGPWCQCSQIADGFDHRAAKLIKVDEALSWRRESRYEVRETQDGFTGRPEMDVTDIAVAVRRFDH